MKEKEYSIVLHTNYYLCTHKFNLFESFLLLFEPFAMHILSSLPILFTFSIAWYLFKYLGSVFAVLQVLDDKSVKRRFRASNYQSTTRVKPFICTMPMRLDDGWNQIQFNLSDFTRRAYGTNYIETLRVQVSHVFIHFPAQLPDNDENLSLISPAGLSCQSCGKILINTMNLIVLWNSQGYIVSFHVITECPLWKQIL